MLATASIVRALRAAHLHDAPRAELLRLACEKIRGLGAPYTSVYAYMLHGDELVLEAFSGREADRGRAGRPALTPARRRRSRRRHIAPPFPRQARVLPGVPPRRRPGRRGMSRNQPCAAILPDRLIVVGDLHLGEGATPVRGRVSGEHFFHDREFASWLRRLSSHGARRGRRLELVLNGDAFDFLRVI